jgi:nitrogen-specific signal transduction histidine kinase
MPDERATPEFEVGTGRSMPQPAEIPDRAQRAAIMGQLSGGILHEFNNILTVVTGTIDLLAQAVANRPELAAIARLIDDTAVRGARLTSHLLAFERGQPPRYRDVDVNTLLSDAARLLSPVLGDRAEIAPSIAAEVSTVVADPGLLLAAVLSLGIAAREVMPGGGRIAMATTTLQAQGSPVSDLGATAADETVAVTIDAISDAIVDELPARIIGELEMIEDLVKRSGGDVAARGPTERGFRFEIHLRKAMADPEG